jgi:glycosyltransferase involved in cell wall biosynthesis
VHIIDDCSTDNSWFLIEQIQKEHPTRILANKTPVNVGAKRIIEFSKFSPQGDFWGVIDGDDWWISIDKVRLQVEKLLSNSKFVGCLGTTVVLDSLGNLVNKIRPSIEIWNYLDYLLKIDGLYIHYSSVLWKNVFKAKSNFLPKLMNNGWPGGEWPLTLAMLSESGGWLCHIDNDVSVYNFSGFGLWSSQDELTRFEENKKSENQMREVTPFWQKLLAQISKHGGRSLSNFILYNYAFFKKYLILYNKI